MATTSVATLLTAPSRADVEAKMLGLLGAAGFPTTSWQSTSVPRVLVGMFASVLVDFLAFVPKIAASAFLSTATGDWLKVTASEVYGVDASAGVTAIGAITFSASASAPTYTLTPGTLVAKSANGRTYQNTTGGVLGPGTSLAVTFAADDVGAAFNVNGELVTLATPLPGVTATAASGLAWLTTLGVDAEIDDSIRARCRAKWSTLGAGGGAPAYVFNARAADPTVTRVRVDEATPTGGSVTLTLASQSGTVSPAAVANVRAFLEDGRRPQCVTVLVQAATSRAVFFRGPVTVKASTFAGGNTLSALASAIVAYETALDIGATVPLSELVAIVMGLPGVLNFVPKRADGVTTAVAGGDDVVLGPTEVATFDMTGLSWVLA